MEILKNNHNSADTTTEIDAARMEESEAMARLKRVKLLTNHSTGTVADLDAAIMEESVVMACS